MAKIPASANTALIKKAQSSGISLSTLKTVYKRGQVPIEFWFKTGVSITVQAGSTVIFVVQENTIPTRGGKKKEVVAKENNLIALVYLLNT